MAPEIAYFRGELIPADRLAVPVYDAGFVLGATVTEQLRTFRGELYRWRDHLARFRHSLKIVGIEIAESDERLTEIATELTLRNFSLLPAGGELGLAMWATPGPFAAMAPPDYLGPTLCLHTHPAPLASYAHAYLHGQRLVTATNRQVSPACWPRELKCRSRMHYYLADAAANRRYPGARAIMLDEDGAALEATTANLLLYFQGEGLVSPPTADVLPGISVMTVRDLAASLAIPMSERRLTRDDVRAADEVLLAGTTPCLLPCVTLDDERIGGGRPGPIFQRLIAAWGEAVGVDIVGQATA